MSKPLDLSPTELRQLQLIELEMATEVDRICRKNHINYSLDGGTLLGAARHKGFIPWDDDMDLIFTRREYTKFCKACKTDLDTSRFFLQEYRTDADYRWGYAKLRRLGTEYVRAGQEHMKYRTGICIDLFVLDNVSDNALLRKLFYVINYIIRKVMYSELGKKAEKNPLLRAWYKVLSFVPRDLMFRLRNSIAKYCNRRTTELMSHLLLEYPSKETKYGVPSRFFKSFQDIEFEGMMFRTVTEYDAYLSLLYHDYMQLPPVEKRVGHCSASKIKLLDISLEEIQKQKGQ